MKNDYCVVKEIIFLFLLVQFAWDSPLYAQKQMMVDYQYVLQEIEQELKVGEVLALRDAALLLERRTVKADALEVLKRYTLFSPREFKLSEYTTKSNFLNFFYTYQEQFRFSIPLQAFYLTALEERNLSYKVELIGTQISTDLAARLREHIELFEQALELEDEKSATTQIERISELKSPESAEYLRGLIAQKYFRRKYEALTKDVIKELTSYQDRASLELILDLYENTIIAKPFLREQLRNLTNIAMTSSKIEEYNELLNSLGSIRAMRQYGYDQNFTFRPFYFTDTIDYYGKILMISDSLPAVQRNVVEDLIASRKPQALYYLAAKIYRIARQKDKSKLDVKVLYNRMQSLLSTRLLIPGENNTFVEEPNWEEKKNPEAIQNFIHYWSIHYENYEWDKYRSKFINKTLSSTLEKRYKLYLQQLNSTNDAVAWEAYLKLTEGEPSEVARLTERFRHVLNNHNSKLPPMQYAYLERLADLTAFCRRNNILYEPTPSIDRAIDSLILNLKPKSRYLLEKTLLSKIKITDLTALEYLACLYVVQEDLMYSLAWILDRSYTRYWTSIIEDDQQLRLYLKKAYLFSRIGTEGICNYYLNKLDASSDKTRLRLMQLLELETDKDIIYQIEKILAKREKLPTRNWKDLMEEDFDIGLLNAPKTEELAAIFEQLNGLEDKRIQLKIIFYLSLHPDVTQTPYLVELLRAGILEREVISLLERIYAHEFRSTTSSEKEQWLNYWERNRLTYQNWGTQFIEIQINRLSANERISIYELNAITQSPYYKAIYRNICLSMLQKVYPIRNLRRLKMDYKLKVSKELKYIASIDFKDRELLDLVSILYIDQEEDLLDFYSEQIESWSNLERIDFFIRIINMEWFQHYINDKELDEKWLAQLKKDLNKYLDNRRTSEQQKEDAAIALARLEMIDRSPMERLRLTYKMDVSEPKKAAIQAEILKTSTYHDLDTILVEYTKLSPELNYNVLHDHFGLPIFDLSNSKNRNDILDKLVRFKKDTSGLYRHYLRDFEVDFEDERGRLDFDKIFELLKYDVVYPFSTNAMPRNYYTNSLVKLLELHFKRDLGLGAYYSTRETNTKRSLRAYTWMRFLEQQKAVKAEDTVPNSFTYSYIRQASS
ncbi:MAG: hypothetical protein AAF849_22960 [Bacteroidota bacterium]